MCYGVALRVLKNDKGRISYYTIYKIKEGTALILVLITIFMNIYCEDLKRD